MSDDRRMILTNPIFIFNIGFYHRLYTKHYVGLSKTPRMTGSSRLSEAAENRSGAKWRMTIAEAGSVGGIKHNFSVMVRGVGFSTLIISSTSQSRPLSRPPASLSPRSRVSLYLSVSLPVYPRSWEYISMHFPGPLASTRPFHPLLLLFSRAILCFHRLFSYPTRQLSSSPPILSSSRSFYPSLFSALFRPSFSRFNYQLFPVFQKFALKRTAFSRR